MDRGDLDRLLALLTKVGGTDLHVKPGTYPSFRVDGELRSLSNEPHPLPRETEVIARTIIPNRLTTAFDTRREADFGYSIPDVGRFRVNVYYQRGLVSLAFRRVRTNPESAEHLGLPPIVNQLVEAKYGLVLVTGPAGAGKSTTLASMIDHINRIRPCHIITIEDPIEYIHQDRLARIEQREVGFDTESFSQAMRGVLRQDPDVILVGEMRDRETAWAAMSAAETGHLVLSTLHTINASETISRFVDFFPSNHLAQIRIALAGSLRATVAQRLVRSSDGEGRLPAAEIMVVNGRIRQCITQMDRTEQIPDIIAAGQYEGMQTFDQSLASHFISGKITLDEALENATKPHDLRLLLEKQGFVSTERGGYDPLPWERIPVRGSG